MTRPNKAALAAFLLAALALFGGVALARGALFIEKHEGDTYHLIELVLRVSEGQWPHLDFMTPIGVLALAPVAAFVTAGLGFGQSLLMAQMALGLALLPAALRVGSSRMSGVWPYVFGLVIVVLCTAIVHGEADRALSISMHYNRWAWAVSYVIVMLVVLDPVRDPAPTLDGAIVGVGIAALALTKITYFVAFFPPLALALIIKRQWRMLAAAALAGLVCGAVMTALAGVEFWFAYIGDLAAVALSEGRQQPGEDLATTITAPAYLGASFLLLAAVIALRQARLDTPGLLLLLLAPAFVYVTFQNYGNDPQWLYLVAILMFVLRPAGEVRNGVGWDMRAAMLVIGVAAFSHGAPSAFNLLYSPFRHLFLKDTEFASLLSREGLSEDIRARKPRLFRTNGGVILDVPGTEDDTWADEEDRLEPTLLNGEVLRECDLQVGMNAWFVAAAKDLTEAGFAGARLFTTDVFNAYPLFGDFPLLEGGAPWYYGNLSGFAAADYVIVPLCPIVPDVRAEILKELEKRDIALTEVRRTALYILLRKTAS